MKNRAKKSKWADGERIIIFCPGCNDEHAVDLKRWEFDGNFEFPTISPSLHLIIRTGSSSFICHSFIRSGQIQYLEDSTHKLAGKTVNLPKKYQ